MFPFFISRYGGIFCTCRLANPLTYPTYRLTRHTPAKNKFTYKSTEEYLQYLF